MLSTDVSSIDIKDIFQVLIKFDKAQLDSNVSRKRTSCVNKLYFHLHLIHLRFRTQTRRLQHLSTSLDLCSCMLEQRPNNVTVRHRDRTVCCAAQEEAN